MEAAASRGVLFGVSASIFFQFRVALSFALSNEGFTLCPSESGAIRLIDGASVGFFEILRRGFVVVHDRPF